MYVHGTIKGNVRVSIKSIYMKRALNIKYKQNGENWMKIEQRYKGVLKV